MQLLFSIRFINNTSDETANRGQEIEVEFFSQIEDKLGGVNGFVFDN
jgi:hypothetical protein